ncbi:hypothetical protein IAR50_001736 [Cryptococcus sp. DSM 104548]
MRLLPIESVHASSSFNGIANDLDAHRFIPSHLSSLTTPSHLKFCANLISLPKPYCNNAQHPPSSTSTYSDTTANGRSIRWADEPVSSTMTTTIPPSSQASSRSSSPLSYAPISPRSAIAPPTKDGWRSRLASTASSKASSAADWLSELSERYTRESRPYSQSFASSRSSSPQSGSNAYPSRHYSRESESYSSDSDDSSDEWKRVDRRADPARSSNPWPRSIAPTSNHYVSRSSQSGAPRMISRNSSACSQPQLPPTNGPKGILKDRTAPSNGPWSSGVPSRRSYSRSSKQPNDIVSILRSALSEALTPHPGYSRKSVYTYVSSRPQTTSRPSSHFSSKSPSVRFKVNIYNNSSSPFSSSSDSAAPSVPWSHYNIVPHILERRRIHAKKSAFENDVRSLAESYGFVTPRNAKLEGTGPAGRRLGTWDD